MKKGLLSLAVEFLRKTLFMCSFKLGYSMAFISLSGSKATDKPQIIFP